MTTERLGSLERDVAEIKDRLDRMEARFDTQFAMLNQRFDNMQAQMITNPRWSAGISMTLWATAIRAVIFT